MFIYLICDIYLNFLYQSLPESLRTAVSKSIIGVTELSRIVKSRDRLHAPLRYYTLSKT